MKKCIFVVLFFHRWVIRFFLRHFNSAFWSRNFVLRHFNSMVELKSISGSILILQISDLNCETAKFSCRENVLLYTTFLHILRNDVMLEWHMYISASPTFDHGFSWFLLRHYGYFYGTWSQSESKNISDIFYSMSHMFESSNKLKIRWRKTIVLHYRYKNCNSG